MINKRVKIDDRSKEFNARFRLGMKGKKNLVVIGVNPSIATIDNLDQTSKRVEKYSDKHEYEGWILLNLYPQIYKDVSKIVVEKNDELVKQNLEFIESILCMKDITLVAAWGEAIEWRKYHKDCLREIDDIAKKYNHQWYCFELTKYGHPCHPLMRTKGFRFYETHLSLFEINRYFKS